MFIGLLVLMASAQAQNADKNNAAVNLELIELLGGLDDSADDSVANLDLLEDAMQPIEASTIRNKPMTTKVNTHPAGGEK